MSKLCKNEMWFFFEQLKTVIQLSLWKICFFKTKTPKTGVKFLCYHFSIFHSLLTSWKITNNIYLPHDVPSSSRMRRGLVLQSQTAMPSVFVQPSSQPFASHGSGSPKSLKLNWAFYHTVYVTFRVKFTESLLSKNKTILIRKSTS